MSKGTETLHDWFNSKARYLGISKDDSQIIWDATGEGRYFPSTGMVMQDARKSLNVILRMHTADEDLSS